MRMLVVHELITHLLSCWTWYPQRKNRHDRRLHAKKRHAKSLRASDLQTPFSYTVRHPTPPVACHHHADGQLTMPLIYCDSLRWRRSVTSSTW